jgi:hypothetical protein
MRDESEALGFRRFVNHSSFILHPLICALGLWCAFRPTLVSGFARMQADAGDTLLNHYVLEHSWLCLTRPDYVGTWWSPPCFYPQPLTLAYSENLFGTAPLYWLLRALCSDVLAFQLWMLLVAALTYAAMAWALHRLNVRPTLAALGAYVFAFGLPRLTQIGHQQLLPEMFAPLALFAAGRFLQAPAIGALAGVLVASYLQILSSIYLGWFLMLGLSVFFVVYMIVDRETMNRMLAFLRRRAPTVIVLVAIWGGLLFALLSVYAEANRGFHRQYTEVRELIPRPASWLASAPQGVWYDVLPHRLHEPNSELWIFPGVVPIVMGVAAIIGLRTGMRDAALITVCLLTAGILAVLALRWGDSSLWYWIWKWAPGGGAIRAVSRIWTMILLFGFVGGLAAVSQSLGSKRIGWIGPVLLVLGVAEQIPGRSELLSFDAAKWTACVDSVHGQMKPKQVHLIGLMPGIFPYQGQLVAMWAGLKANAPVVNGYSGRYPLNYPDWNRTMTGEQLQNWLIGRYSGPVEIIHPAAAQTGPGFD